MGLDQRVAYTQRILRGYAFYNHEALLIECKQSVKEIAGDKWDLVALKEISTDDFWTRAKKYVIVYYGDSYQGLDKCAKIEKKLWFR